MSHISGTWKNEGQVTFGLVKIGKKFVEFQNILKIRQRIFVRSSLGQKILQEFFSFMERVISVCCMSDVHSAA